MEYPQNPSKPFRIETISAALILLLGIATIQPLVVIATSVVPFDFADGTWRVRTFALILGASPQVSVCLVLLAVIGLFSERYLAVRAAAVAAISLGAVLIPILILYWLDILQIRRMVSMEMLRRFDLNALQTAIITAVMSPALIWMGICGLKAGKRVPTLDIADALMLNQEPAAGPLDPRVLN